MRVLVAIVYAILSTSRVESVCYCPTVMNRNPRCRAGLLFSDNNKGGTCWESLLLDREACNDYELQGECELAAWEINDYITGRYTRTHELLEVLQETGNITTLEFAATMATVTSVIEDNKINMGLNLECSLGLQTTQLVNDQVLSWCFSPQLHAVCMQSRENGPRYVQSIIPSLRQAAVRDPRVSTTFIDLFEMQFVDQSNTLDIHCNVTVHHFLNVIAGAPSLPTSLAMLGAAIVTSLLM